MKKNALAFISALLMSAAVFVSCSDSSDSDPDSPVPGNSVSDGSGSGSAKYVTAAAKEDGIHFSIEIPAQFEKWGIGSINIYNETEDEGIVHPEAGVDRNSVSDLMYPLVEPGKTYTFRVAIEPGYDRTVPGWRQDAYNENVTVTAVGGLGEIKAGSVPKAEVTKYKERVETVHEKTCGVYDPDGYDESKCNCKGHEQTSIYVHYKDSVKENFSYPNGTAKSTDVAAVCVGDAKDDWELYTQWVGGYSVRYDDDTGGFVSFGSDYDDYKLFNKCREIAKGYKNDSIMIQRRWELDVPSAKGLFFIITSLSEPADVEKVKAESKE
ncbi:MAG: hypothetical protein J6K96_09345 [Treponema sp.]|nr:hypothetical protein [Treponema sp.]